MWTVSSLTRWFTNGLATSSLVPGRKLLVALIIYDANMDSTCSDANIDSTSYDDMLMEIFEMKSVLF